MDIKLTCEPKDDHRRVHIYLQDEAGDVNVFATVGDITEMIGWFGTGNDEDGKVRFYPAYIGSAFLREVFAVEGVEGESEQLGVG